MVGLLSSTYHPDRYSRPGAQTLPLVLRGCPFNGQMCRLYPADFPWMSCIMYRRTTSSPHLQVPTSLVLSLPVSWTKIKRISTSPWSLSYKMAHQSHAGGWRYIALRWVRITKFIITTASHLSRMHTFLNCWWTNWSALKSVLGLLVRNLSLWILFSIRKAWSGVQEHSAMLLVMVVYSVYNSTRWTFVV